MPYAAMNQVAAFAFEASNNSRALPPLSARLDLHCKTDVYIRTYPAPLSLIVTIQILSFLPTSKGPTTSFLTINLSQAFEQNR